MTAILIKKITEVSIDKEYIFTMPEPVHFIMTDLYRKMKSIGHNPTFIHIYHDLPPELKEKIKLQVKERMVN
jgi:hypothetical protein